MLQGEFNLESDLVYDSSSESQHGMVLIKCYALGGIRHKDKRWHPYFGICRRDSLYFYDAKRLKTVVKDRNPTPDLVFHLINSAIVERTKYKQKNQPFLEITLPKEQAIVFVRKHTRPRDGSVIYHEVVRLNTVFLRIKENTRHTIPVKKLVANQSETKENHPASQIRHEKALECSWLGSFEDSVSITKRIESLFHITLRPVPHLVAEQKKI